MFKIASIILAVIAGTMIAATQVKLKTPYTLIDGNGQVLTNMFEGVSPSAFNIASQRKWSALRQLNRKYKTEGLFMDSCGHITSLTNPTRAAGPNNLLTKSSPGRDRVTRPMDGGGCDSQKGCGATLISQRCTNDCFYDACGASQTQVVNTA